MFSLLNFVSCLFQVVHPLLGLLHFVVQKLRGQVGLVALHRDVLLRELGHQFANHRLRLVPVGVREGDGEGRGAAAAATASHFDM